MIDQEPPLEQDEQAQQQNQPQSQSPLSGYYQPTIMPSEKADLYEKINPSDIVDELKYKLMGWYFDNNNQRWICPPTCKGISEMGANEIMTTILAASSENTTVSKLNDDEIRTLVRSLHKTVMIMCIKNWRDYHINGSDQIQQISQVVKLNTFITLKAIENAGVREFLGKSSSENKQIVEETKPKGMVAQIFRR